MELCCFYSYKHKRLWDCHLILLGFIETSKTRTKGPEILQFDAASTTSLRVNNSFSSWMDLMVFCDMFCVFHLWITSNKLFAVPTLFSSLLVASAAPCTGHATC